MRIVDPDGLDGPLREDRWQGVIDLPRLGAGSGAGNWLFLADLSGASQSFPFDSSRDTFALTPVAEAPILHRLIESRFTPSRWKVRTRATHAKSKTLARETHLREKSRFATH